MEFRKKLVLVAAAIFILASGITASAQQQVGVFVSPESATSGSGYYVSLEALFLQAHIQEPLGGLDSDDDDSQFMVDDDDASALPIEDASWGRDGGFRAAIGKNVVNSPWDVSFEFTYINSGDVKDLVGSDDRRLMLTFMNFDHTEGVRNLRSETNLEVFYGDFMARYKVKLGDNFLFGMGGGLRFAVVEDDRLLTGTGDECENNILGSSGAKDIFSGCAVSQREDYWGVGPRIQVSFGWAATDRLSIFTNLGFTILAGELDLRTDEKMDDFDGGRFITQNVRGQIVPVVDSQIGINYQSGNLGIRLGYEFQNWFDLHDRSLITSADDDAEHFVDVNKGDIGFEGPFARITLGF